MDYTKIGFVLGAGIAAVSLGSVIFLERWMDRRLGVDWSRMGQGIRPGYFRYNTQKRIDQITQGGFYLGLSICAVTSIIKLTRYRFIINITSV